MLEAARGPAPAAQPRALPRILLRNEDGAPVVKAASSAIGTRLDLDEAVAPAFAAFLAERLPKLYAEYRSALPSRKDG